MIFSEKVERLAERALKDVESQFAQIDNVAKINTQKVLSAFHRHRVSDACFAGTTGYGYNDKGRDTLDLIYADVFGAEAALVRQSFANGTHAITAALFASLRPGQTLLSVAGTPYDTIHGVIGISGNFSGSLKDYGISYKQVDFKDDYSINFEAIADAVSDKSVGAVLIQLSRGYSSRPALSPEQIRKICQTVRENNVSVNIFVDNCYGEFVNTEEPGDCGADIMAGSLIKNPGGGLVPTGAYVAGRKDLVEAAAHRLTAPGIGGECGALPEGYRLMYQGLFTAPHTVAQSLKTAVFCAKIMELMGYKTYPAYDETRYDIIQTVEFGSPDLLEKFCRGIQAGAPIDSFVTPVPWEMPGYDDPVIMAAGTFVQGSTMELSADGPMRPPYSAYLQGGLTFESGQLGIMLATEYLTGSH